MKLTHPSTEFDEAVAAVCHGTVSDEQARSLNELLRNNQAARDAYIQIVELHSRLASTPEFFAEIQRGEHAFPKNLEENQITRRSPASAAPRRTDPSRTARILSLAAALALVTGWWAWIHRPQEVRRGATSNAVAILNTVVDAQWDTARPSPTRGTPIEPGRLRLNAGLAQIVFYSGTRVVIEGPAEFEILAANKAAIHAGRLVVEAPPPAQAFHLNSTALHVTGSGTTFGMDVSRLRADLHLFKGSVDVQSSTGGERLKIKEGSGITVEAQKPMRGITANNAAFNSLFRVEERSTAAAVRQHESWRASSRRLDEDPSLLVHFDFEPADASEWRLANRGSRNANVSDATIVGCQWVEGRWPEKHALEFRGASDRVRLSVPGEFESLTLATWIRVQGLDRQFNSLFMSDGFESGTLHWLIRHDGVLGLTVIGSDPPKHQIVRTPPLMTLDRLGLWLHLAVVVDGEAREVVHYVNGIAASRSSLKIVPPYRIGSAELGNWNASGFSGNDPSLIRNFSGAMDEFCLFERALSSEDILALYSTAGARPEPPGDHDARQPKRLRSQH